MTNHTTIDGRTIFDWMSGNNTTITINIRRFEVGLRSSIFIFGTYGICGVLNIEDGGNSTGISCHFFGEYKLTVSVNHNDVNGANFTLYNFIPWGYYKFIGCNCYFV